MKFQAPTVIGKIIKRYKRFLADVELPTGEVITAHIANTGSMKTCWEAGWKCLLTHHDNPNRKLKYSVEMIHNGISWIGVNTAKANSIVEEALKIKKISGLEDYQAIKREHKIGKSRIDFFLSNSSKNPDCFIEVKSVTLLGEDNQVQFPDGVSERGQKHLEELIEIKKSGMRAIIFFLIQREDNTHFTPAAHIDPYYADLLDKAKEVGVEIMVYQCQLTTKEITLFKKIPYTLSKNNRLKSLAKRWEFMPKSQAPFKVKIPKDQHLIFFGGSFNPWHKGHHECIKLLNKNKNLFIIPDHNPQKNLSHKGIDPWTRYQNLLEQTPRKIPVYSGFWSVDKANPTASWLPHIKTQFPKVKLSLLIGFDSFIGITNWIDAPKVLTALNSLYIVSRHDDLKLKEKQITFLNKNYPHLELIFLGSHAYEDLSSRHIRSQNHHS